MGYGQRMHIAHLQTRRSSKAKVKAIFSAANFISIRLRVAARIENYIGAPSETRNVIFNGIVCALQSTIHYVHIYTFRTRMKITYNFTRNFVH